MDHLKGHAFLAEMILGHVSVYRSCLEVGVSKAADEDDKHYWNHELKALAEIEAACAVEMKRDPAQEEREAHLKLWSRVADLCRPGLGSSFNSDDAFAWLKEALAPVNRGKLQVIHRPFDGSFRVGYSNTDEAGGFTVVGDITDQVPFIKSCLKDDEKHTGLTFGAALAALKEGYRVTREEWKSSDSIAVLEICKQDFHAPYFRMGHFKRGDEPFYVIGGPGLEDMEADDWAIAPDEAEESLRA